MGGRAHEEDEKAEVVVAIVGDVWALKRARGKSTAQTESSDVVDEQLVVILLALVDEDVAIRLEQPQSLEMRNDSRGARSEK